MRQAYRPCNYLSLRGRCHAPGATSLFGLLPQLLSPQHRPHYRTIPSPQHTLKGTTPMPKDMWDADETDNRLSWFVGTITEDYYSDAVTESGGKATFQNADQIAHYFTVAVDDVLQDYSGKPMETISLKLGLGKGWEKTPAGSAVRHEDDDEKDPDNDKQFDIRSGFGQFLALIQGKRSAWTARRVVMLDGGPDEVEYDFAGVRDYMRKNDYSDPRESGIWVGTRWLFRGFGFQYTDEATELRATPRPVAFLGTSDDQSAGKSKSAAGRTAKTVEVTPQQVGVKLSDAGSTCTPEQAEQLAKLLETSSSHSAFARNALALPDLPDEMKTAIMDQANGLWSVRS